MLISLERSVVGIGKLPGLPCRWKFFTWQLKLYHWQQTFSCFLWQTEVTNSRLFLRKRMPAIQVWITSLATVPSSKSGIPWKVICLALFTIAQMLFFKTTKKICYMHKPIQTHKVLKRQSIVNKLYNYWLIKDILPWIYGSEHSSY